MNVVILTKLANLNESLDVANILFEESDENSVFDESSDFSNGAIIAFEESDESDFDQSNDFVIGANILFEETMKVVILTKVTFPMGQL